jgi:tetratricopeptide (TPR) repeat protein
MSDPAYIQALQHFQRGEWAPGIQLLETLVNSYPYEHSLRAMIPEMQLRQKIEQDEIEDNDNLKKRKIRTWGARIGAAALVVGAMVWGVLTYAGWINQQWLNARMVVEQEAQQMQLNLKYNNARSLLSANRPAEAVVLLKEIAEVAPDYPNLTELIANAESMGKLDAQYVQASDALQAEEYDLAQDLFQAIYEIEPNYKDVALRLESIQGLRLLMGMLADAQQAIKKGDWASAAAMLESLRAIDPNYKTSEVEEALFKSYLQAAEKVLADPQSTVEALQVADMYYRKALALRPQNQETMVLQVQSRADIEERLVNSYVQSAREALLKEGDSLAVLADAEALFNQALALRPNDPAIQLQLEMARGYIQAQALFTRDAWSDAILILEAIYQEEQEYANGTARQALYEAYIARGNDALAAGSYEAGLTDFQRAAVLAEEAPDSVLRLYEAQLKVAYALGLLGNYPDAVLIYRNAVLQSAFQARAAQQNASIASALGEAEALAEAGNYKIAYLRYRDVLRRSNEVYDYVTHVVEPGEYLTALARRYNSTVEAIAAANDIADPNNIIAGQEILIPTLP